MQVSWMTVGRWAAFAVVATLLMALPAFADPPVLAADPPYGEWITLGANRVIAGVTNIGAVVFVVMGLFACVMIARRWFKRAVRV
jgi:hypothetical protein